MVVHADDIGMCHSTLPAIDELMAFGLVTSASAMVPCPWFLEVVAWHQRNPQFDLGIHLTLTSEWERYRWGPISTRAVASGLLDDQGYFHRTARPCAGTHSEKRSSGDVLPDRTRRAIGTTSVAYRHPHVRDDVRRVYRRVPTDRMQVGDSRLHDTHTRELVDRTGVGPATGGGMGKPGPAGLRLLDGCHAKR